ncbi:MAG: hypothetical protein IIW70_05980 [Bacteroidales bacterium]|nr:hypothetical protein [Bacteroidales bacterium]
MKKDYVYERLSKAEREQLEQLEKEHPYVDLLTDAVPIRYGDLRKEWKSVLIKALRKE